MHPSTVKYVITSPLSLARVLWWYGEDELWTTALELAPATVADLAPRFAELRAAPTMVELLWPGAPLADAHLVLGIIEHFEGHPRPAVRRHRRGGPIPDALDLSEDERWRDPASRRCSGSSSSEPGRPRAGRTLGNCTDSTDGMPPGEAPTTDGRPHRQLGTPELQTLAPERGGQPHRHVRR